MKSEKSGYCRNRDCWDCRFNRNADSLGRDCGRTYFKRMFNLNVVRLQYLEKEYYKPEYFRWMKPSEVFIEYDKRLGHRVILLGSNGDIRTGELIAPNSEPTMYIPSGTDIWFRYSRKPSLIVCYPVKSIEGIIDMDDYNRESHWCRIVLTDDYKYRLVTPPVDDDLPF